MPRLAIPTYFPPISRADEDGLLMIGGELSQERLVTAYKSGVFPWPIVDGNVEVLSWWAPDPRAIVELDDLHVSSRLKRRMRGGQFHVTINQDFEGVVKGCAEPRDDEVGTWITRQLIQAYSHLHFEGLAHSVEVWSDSKLVGGLYGVAIGGFFAGESMFHRTTDASKVALVHLVNHLKSRGFVLFDIQQPSPHMMRMGASEIPRREFLARLKRAIKLPVSFDEATTGAMSHR